MSYLVIELSWPVGSVYHPCTYIWIQAEHLDTRWVPRGANSMTTLFIYWLIKLPWRTPAVPIHTSKSYLHKIELGEKVAS